MGTKASKSKTNRILVKGWNSGVTTYIHWLKHGNAETKRCRYGDFLSTMYQGFEVYDPGMNTSGRVNIPSDTYYKRLGSTVGIVYIIDSAQTTYIEEAKLDMLSVLKDERLMEDVVVAVVANKQDLPGTMTPELIEKIYINDQILHKPLKVFPGVATKGEGIYESLDWMICEIRKKQKIEAAIEPWKEVANDMAEEGKDGLQRAKIYWHSCMRLLNSRS